MNDDLKRGKFLYDLRIKHNLKQSELAKMIGYSDKSISKWERGVSYPKDNDIIIKLAKIFDVSVEELLLGEYSDVEGKIICSFNNNILKFIYKFRKTFLLILIIILLVFIYHFVLLDFPNFDLLILNGGNKINNFNDEVNDFIDNNNDIKNLNNSYKSVNNENLGIVNNINDILLDEGFVFKNNYYEKYINDHVIFRYFLENNSFKIYDYSNSEYFVIIYGFLSRNDFYVDIDYFNNHDIIYFDSIDNIECNFDNCDYYNQYIEYINHIKDLLLE